MSTNQCCEQDTNFSKLHLKLFASWKFVAITKNQKFNLKSWSFLGKLASPHFKDGNNLTYEKSIKCAPLIPFHFSKYFSSFEKNYNQKIFTLENYHKNVSRQH